MVAGAPGLPVTVYNGQLDLICCTLGVDRWLDKLHWPGMRQFQALRARPVHAAEKAHRTAAFVKQHQNLMLFVVLKAGHMVPADQPRTALEMVSSIVEFRGVVRQDT